jgi:chemotaxis protein methyltransferase CheR
MAPASITDREFAQFQRFIFDAAGINLSPAKKALVSGRLAKRLQQHRLGSYGDYFRLIASGDALGEAQTAIDLLTTNETYFFREPRHFEMLREHASATRKRTEVFRVWSAASSSGEEAYSIAMTLGECLEDGLWEVVGTDISLRMLQRARIGHYPQERCKQIPSAHLRRYCLRGIGAQQGTVLIDRQLRKRVKFTPANLNTALPQLGKFDAIFLRNVMIYFNDDTKRQVVERVLSVLKPGGQFYIGHAESLNGITDAVRMLAPSIFRKP